MRIGIPAEPVWPSLAVHADARLVAACIAEALVELQGTRSRIEIHDEQAVFSVFTRVQNDSATVRIGGDPVRLLFIVEGYPRYFSDMTQIGDVVGCQRVHRGQR